jgi:hypothetical protein
MADSDALQRPLIIVGTAIEFATLVATLIVIASEKPLFVVGAVGLAMLSGVLGALLYFSRHLRLAVGALLVGLVLVMGCVVGARSSLSVTSGASPMPGATGTFTRSSASPGQSPTQSQTPTTLVPPPAEAVSSIKLVADDTVADFRGGTPKANPERGPILGVPPILLNPGSGSYCPQGDSGAVLPDDVYAIYDTYSANLVIGSEVAASPDAGRYLSGVSQFAQSCGYSTTQFRLGDQAIETVLPQDSSVIDRVWWRHGNLLLEVAIFGGGGRA